MPGRASWNIRAVLIMGLVSTVTVVGFSKHSTESPCLPLEEASAGGPHLISVDALPEPEGEMCEPASASRPLVAALQQGQFSAALAGAVSEQATRLADSARRPVRFIKDPSPSYSAVAVDPVRDEVVLADESLHQLMVYDRLANTPPTAAMTQPKRVIGGLKTDIEYAAQLHIDPANGDIYATDNDTHNRVVMFSRQAQGNVPPDRQLYAPHTTFGLAVDEGAQELYVTEQLDSVVVVWKKTAQKGDSPVRLLQGDRTRLQDPHGIAFDTKNRLMFITNFGSVRRKVAEGGTQAQTVDPSGRLAQTSPAPGIKNWPVNQHVPGSGKKLPPSITIYALDAQGDAPPLRTIEGPKTQLNWPTGIAFEPKRNELYVANDTGDAVLVFNAAASGDVAPVRILKGPKSLIKNPLGVFVDSKNDELWVANFGNHTATVYKTTAAGDTPPLRVIRSTPLGQPAVLLGNPGSVTYDSKRDELLVPN